MAGWAEPGRFLARLGVGLAGARACNAQGRGSRCCAQEAALIVAHDIVRHYVPPFVGVQNCQPAGTQA